MPKSHVGKDYEVGGDLNVVGGATVAGTLGITGVATFVNVSVSGTLGVTGIATFTAAPVMSAGLVSTAQVMTPDATEVAGNIILPGVTAVDVGTVANGVTDFIVLPSLSAVPVGHTITIACNAGGAFEMRTPATSNEKINTVDSDGTQEYLCTDTEVIKVVKVSATDGWMAHAFTALGAVATAVIPD